MRDDHKLALKKIKQQILAFSCLRHGFIYNAGASHWTAAHLSWLRSLEPEGLYKEILSEYLLTYDKLTDTLERLDRRIEELADQDAYRESVRKLCCFLGIKTQTALAVIVEVGDFKRFPESSAVLPHISVWSPVRTPAVTGSIGSRSRKPAIRMSGGSLLKQLSPTDAGVSDSNPRL